MDEAVIESHDISSADRQGMTSILWENTAKLFDATSIAGSLNAHLDSFCDGHFSFKRSSKSKRISCKAGSQERYQPPQNHPKPTAVYKPWSHYFVALRSCRTPYAGMIASLHPPHFWTTWAQLGVSFGQQGVGLVCNLQVLAPIWVQLGPIHFSWLPTGKLT